MPDRPSRDSRPWSALEAAVRQRKADLGLTWKQVQERTNVSPSTLRNIGDRKIGHQDATLEGLREIGFTPGELRDLTRRGRPARDGSDDDEELPKDIRLVKIAMDRMTPGRQALLRVIAEGLRDLQD